MARKKKSEEANIEISERTSNLYVEIIENMKNFKSGNAMAEHANAVLNRDKKYNNFEYNMIRQLSYIKLCLSNKAKNAETSLERSAECILYVYSRMLEVALAQTREEYRKLVQEGTDANIIDPIGFTYSKLDYIKNDVNSDIKREMAYVYTYNYMLDAMAELLGTEFSDEEYIDTDVLEANYNEYKKKYKKLLKMNIDSKYIEIIESELYLEDIEPLKHSAGVIDEYMPQLEGWLLNEGKEADNVLYMINSKMVEEARKRVLNAINEARKE